MNFKPLFCLILAISGGAAFPKTANAGPVSVEELKQHLLAISDKTVEIKGNFVALVADPATGTLEKKGYGNVETTVSLSGSPLMLHKQEPNALSIAGKKDAFFEFYSTIVNNGSYWIRAQDKQGNPGELLADTNEATITKGVNPWVNGKDWLTGVCYLFSFSKVSNQGKKSVLDLVTNGTGPFKIETGTEDGEEFTVLDFSISPYQQEMFLLDPKHGFAMKEHRITFLGGDMSEMTETYRVDEYTDAGDGVWLPKSAVYTKTEGEKVILKYTFVVSKATVLEGKRIEDLVDYKLIKGWKVRDERDGKEYTYGD